MKAVVVTCRDAFNPSLRRESRLIRRRRSLRNLAPRTRQPVICQLNGQWVSRKAWARRVQDGDVVAFVVLPQGGGGGSNPLKVVLQLALAIFAPQIGAWANLQLFAAESGLAFALSNGVLGSVIGGGAMMLLNALTPAPKPPAAQQAQALAAPSPTYTLSAQGNTARLEQPIPVIYGRHLVYPDFGAMPYVEYVGNEQYLYQLFVIGQGSYDIEQIRIEDTPISSFPEITTEIVPPGGRVSLFPANVVTSIEVAGQEAFTGQVLGPFVATPPGVSINALGLDMVMPRGLYYANDDGGLNNQECQWRIEAQRIDDYGRPVSGWEVLTNGSIYGPWSAWAFYASNNPTVSNETVEYRVVERQESIGYGDDRQWVVIRDIEVRTRTRISGSPTPVTYGAWSAWAFYAPGGSAPVSSDTAEYQVVTHQESIGWGDDRQEVDVQDVQRRTRTKTGGGSVDSDFTPWSAWGAHAAGLTAPTSSDTVQYQVISRTESIGLSDDRQSVDVQEIQRRTRSRTDNVTSHSASTATPQRLSTRYAVAEGRYQVRVTRLDTKNTNSRYGHDLVWAGLRGYVPGEQRYGNVTVLAMRLRASNSLSQQASRKVNLIATRCLKTWSVGAGWSATATPTRSIAWACADIARAAYGGELPDARIDLAGLAALDAVWAARGDRFDAIFDSQSTVMEALSLTARAGRGIAYTQGGVARVVRDGPVSVPVQMFTTRNIVKGSLKIDYAMHSEDTADAADVTYFDERVWAERTVRCTLPGSAQAKVAKVKLFGVVDRSHAWREGMFTVACNRYRRRFVSLATEMEGFIPTLADLLVMQHDLPKWGQSGEIVNWNAATKEAILSEPLDWSAGGAHVLAFRLRNGAPSGPYACTAGTDAYRVILSNWSPATDPTPDAGSDRERSHFAFGPTSANSIRTRVLGIRPRSSETVELSTVVESDYVHTADTGAPPPESAWQLPAKLPTLPTIDSIRIEPDPMQRGRVIVSWPPSRGAVRYAVEALRESGAWVLVDSPETPQISVDLPRGVNSRWRVAAWGDLARGPWQEVAWINYRVEPESVANFGISVAAGVANLTLDLPSDAATRSVGRLHIRYSPRLMGAAWDTALPLLTTGPATSVPVRLMAGSYMAKWEGSFGDLSMVAASVVNELDDAFLASNVVDELTDDGRWNGTKTGVVFDPGVGGLKLDSVGTFDDQQGDIDGWGDLDSLGGVLSRGEYQFAGQINLGRVATCRLAPRVDFSPFAPLDDWDSRPGEIDDWVDIDSPTISNSRAWVEGSTSVDGTVWSAWQEVGVGDLAFRQLRARVVVVSDDPAINVLLRSAGVRVDMPDLIQQGADIVSLVSGALRITYPVAFQRSPALSICGQGMGPGDFYEVSAKDRFGFSIVFKVASGAVVVRTFDWTAKDY